MPRGWRRNEAGLSTKDRRGGATRNHTSRGYDSYRYDYQQTLADALGAVNASRGAMRDGAVDRVGATELLHRGWSDLSDYSYDGSEDTACPAVTTTVSLDALTRQPSHHHPVAKNARGICHPYSAPPEGDATKIVVDASTLPRHLLPDSVEFAINFLQKEGKTIWFGAPGRCTPH